MILTKLIIKNYLPWVTSYYTTTYNKQPNIIHKLTFHTLLNEPIFWWDAGVPSIFIITLFLLFFTISFFIHALIHKIKDNYFQSAIIGGIIRNITHVSIKFIFRITIHCIINFFINIKSLKM